MQFYKKLLNLIEPYRKKMLWLLVATAFYEGIRLIAPYLFSQLIDALNAFSPEKMNYIFYLLAATFIIYTLTNIFDYLLDKQYFNLIRSLEKYLPIKAQEKLVSLSLGYHEKEDTGSKISKVQRGVDKINNLVSNFLFEVAPTIFQAIITFFVLLWFDAQMTFVFSIGIPLFLYITYRLNQSVYPMREARHVEYEEAAGKMGQSIININTVKSFVQEDRERNSYASICESVFQKELAELKAVLSSVLTRNMIININRTAVLLFGIYKVYHGQMSIGILVFFLTLSERVYFSLFRLSRAYDRVQEAAVGVERLTDLLGQESDIKNPINGRRAEVTGKIIFDDVSFVYNNDSVNDKSAALNNISFEIKPGETVALVGPSGGGKSTIAKLLYRHYDVTSGKILIDGVDIKDLDLPFYRRQLAIVPQDTEIFNSSVRDNIAYGSFQCDLGKVEEAAKIANAHDFIMKLPDGYNTIVGERGVRLSGGQKQRVGIARAILVNPKILIFDEATSNLDSESEKLIQDSMAKIARGRVMVVIAHRLSTIRHADKIIVLKNGRVVEVGDHKSLIEKGGVYRQLAELQRMGEIV